MRRVDPLSILVNGEGEAKKKGVTNELSEMRKRNKNCKV